MSQPRIKRKHKPEKIRKNSTEMRLDALDALISDFHGRCAYCLNHFEMLGGREAMKIDHFHPTAKGGHRTAYDNLFLCCDRCNQHKSDWWTDPEEQKGGARFLNCCKEMDYNEQLFENEKAELVGATGPAIYHILMIRLNRDDLLRLRLRRRRLRQKVKNPDFLRDINFTATDLNALSDDVDEIIKLIDFFIPEIDSPPRLGPLTQA